MQDQLTPTPAIKRIASLDFLRGIAILGILFINIENFAFPDPWSPSKFGFESDTDHTVRFWVYFLTQGKFYTMFALLFGTGFYIFLERMEKKSFGLVGMDIYARRLLWLFIMGIIHAYFIWDGDVLYHYAICGLILFPFRSLSARSLVFIIALFSSLLLIDSYGRVQDRIDSYESYQQSLRVSDAERTEQDRKRISSWSDRMKPQPPDRTHYEPKKITFLSGVSESFQHIKVHKGGWYYQGLLLRSLIIMITGILFYRAGIFENYRVWSYYWFLTIALLVASLIINYFRYYHWTYEYFHPVLNTWKELIFTFPKELLGISYVLLLNGLYQKFLSGIRFRPISLLGKTALSNYILQSIVLGIIFFGYGFGKFNMFSRVELLFVVGIIWTIQMVLSWIWLKYHKYGPLEFIWRKLTYRSFNVRKDIL